MSVVIPVTGNKRRRTDAEDGATEAGAGLPVTKPPKQIPHAYNNNYTVRLTYADNFLHNVAYNVGSHQTFRTNSIYDPDFTGVGHQPLFRDMWASMYDYYTVLSCEYTIRMYNACAEPITYTEVGTNAQLIGAVNVCLLPTTNANDIPGIYNGTDISPGAEMKNVQTYFLPPDKSLEIKGTLTPGDFIVDAKDADADTAWTAVGSNPAVPRFLAYGITQAAWTLPAGASETIYSAIQTQVILQFTVQFTQVNQTLRITSSSTRPK